MQNLYQHIKKIKIVDNEEESVNKYLGLGWEILNIKTEILDKGQTVGEVSVKIPKGITRFVLGKK